MYYPCSENKDADQLRGNREADLRLCFRPCKLLVFSRTGSNLSGGKKNLCILHIFFFFFDSVKRSFQNYFSSYETGQSVGGAKMGEPPQKNNWHTRKQNLACLTCAPCGARTHIRHSSEMIQ